MGEPEQQQWFLHHHITSTTSAGITSDTRIAASKSSNYLSDSKNSCVLFDHDAIPSPSSTSSISSSSSSSSSLTASVVSSKDRGDLRNTLYWSTSVVLNVFEPFISPAAAASHSTAESSKFDDVTINSDALGGCSNHVALTVSTMCEKEKKDDRLLRRRAVSCPNLNSSFKEEKTNLKMCSTRLNNSSPPSVKVKNSIAYVWKPSECVAYVVATSHVNLETDMMDRYDLSLRLRKHCLQVEARRRSFIVHRQIKLRAHIEQVKYVTRTRIQRDLHESMRLRACIKMKCLSAEITRILFLQKRVQKCFSAAVHGSAIVVQKVKAVLLRNSKELSITSPIFSISAIDNCNDSTKKGVILSPRMRKDNPLPPPPTSTLDVLCLTIEEQEDVQKSPSDDMCTKSLSDRQHVFFYLDPRRIRAARRIQEWWRSLTIKPYYCLFTDTVSKVVHANFSVTMKLLKSHQFCDAVTILLSRTLSSRNSSKFREIIESEALSHDVNGNMKSHPVWTRCFDRKDAGDDGSLSSSSLLESIVSAAKAYSRTLLTDVETTPVKKDSSSSLHSIFTSALIIITHSDTIFSSPNGFSETQLRKAAMSMMRSLEQHFRCFVCDFRGCDAPMALWTSALYFYWDAYMFLEKLFEWIGVRDGRPHIALLRLWCNKFPDTTTPLTTSDFVFESVSLILRRTCLGQVIWLQETILRRVLFMGGRSAVQEAFKYAHKSSLINSENSPQCVDHCDENSNMKSEKSLCDQEKMQTLNKNNIEPMVKSVQSDTQYTTPSSCVNMRLPYSYSAGSNVKLKEFNDSSVSNRGRRHAAGVGLGALFQPPKVQLARLPQSVRTTTVPTYGSLVSGLSVLPFKCQPVVGDLLCNAQVRHELAMISYLMLPFNRSAFDDATARLASGDTSVPDNILLRENLQVKSRTPPRKSLFSEVYPPSSPDLQISNAIDIAINIPASESSWKESVMRLDDRERNLFWNQLTVDFECLPCPDYSRVIPLIAEMKRSLIRLVPVHENWLVADIRDRLDLRHLRQQIDRGALYSNDLIDYFLNMMSYISQSSEVMTRLRAAIATGRVPTVKCPIDILDDEDDDDDDKGCEIEKKNGKGNVYDLAFALRCLFETLESLETSMCVSLLGKMRPYIVKNIVEYERSCFALELASSSRKLPLTSQWLYRSFKTSSEAHIRLEKRSKLFNEAFIMLFSLPVSTCMKNLPETLIRDGHRILAAHTALESCIIASTLIVSIQAISLKVKHEPSNEVVMLRAFFALLEETDINGQCNKSISEDLTEQCMAFVSPSNRAIESSLRDIVAATLSRQNPVYKLMHKRAFAVLRTCLNSPMQSTLDIAAKGGMGIQVVSIELADIAKNVRILVSHNLKVHSPYYDALIPAALHMAFAKSPAIN